MLRAATAQAVRSTNLMTSKIGFADTKSAPWLHFASGTRKGSEWRYDRDCRRKSVQLEVMLVADSRITVSCKGRPDLHADICQKIFPLTQPAGTRFRRRRFRCCVHIDRTTRETCQTRASGCGQLGSAPALPEVALRDVQQEFGIVLYGRGGEARQAQCC